METNINVRQALRVFQKVLDHGTRKGEATTYKRLDASTSYDGYTVILNDECVTLTIFFIINSPSITPVNGHYMRFSVS